LEPLVRTGCRWSAPHARSSFWHQRVDGIGRWLCLMKTSTSLKLLGATAGLTFIPIGSLEAQPPEERFSIMLGGSMTGAGDVEYKGGTLGELETNRYKIEAGYSIPLNGEWMFEIGGTYDALEADFTKGISMIPENLTAASVNLRAMWRMDEKLSLSASIAPGFYGDDEVDFSDALNAPLMVLGFWQKSENLSVAFGVRVDAFSDMPVLPVLGVNWKINPEWELSFGVPRTELRYRWDERLSFFGGFAMEGNSYAVDDPALVTSSGKSLGDTHVSESEFRALMGLEYKLNSGVMLNLQGGYGFGREFDYHDEDVKLEADPAAFGAVSVSFAF